MPTFRTRATIAVLVSIAALGGCGTETSSPLEPVTRPQVSADVDTVRRVSAAPTLPWVRVEKPGKPAVSGT